MTGGHVQMECSNEDCGGTCPACCLAWCRVCGGAEASLPTECPGKLMTQKQQNDVHNKKMDFVGEKWKKL